MKPLFHPSVEDMTVEAILHALSDPVRVAIFAEMAGSSRASNCSSFLQVRGNAVPKSTLSQHFNILRDAGLIRSVRQGIQMQNTSRCQEIEKRFPGLIPAIVGALQTQLKGKTRSGGAGKTKNAP